MLVSGVEAEKDAAAGLGATPEGRVGVGLGTEADRRGFVVRLGLSSERSSLSVNASGSEDSIWREDERCFSRAWD